LELHTSPVGGHSGFLKTYHRVKKDFFWDGNIALYGYHPPSITSSLKEKSKVQAMEDHIENQQQVLQISKDNLTMAQNRMKQQADQHCSERSFEVGD
jgi:hypothetical protein